jgi:hypothetical protein
MSMANAMTASAGAREAGPCSTGARLRCAGLGPRRSPLGGYLATIASLTLHAIDGLSHAA